jgi:hypothetical protein
LHQLAVHDQQPLPETVTKRKRLVPSHQEWRNQPMTGSAKLYAASGPNPLPETTCA